MVILQYWPGERRHRLHDRLIVADIDLWFLQFLLIGQTSELRHECLLVHEILESVFTLSLTMVALLAR